MVFSKVRTGDFGRRRPFLPRIQAELGLSDAGRSWVIAAYVLAFGGLMLLGGRLSDAFGRKRVFLAGVALFTATSIVCGAAGIEGTLVIGRVLQGAAAAVASPTAMALIATTFAAGKVRNQAFAICAAMTGAGSVAGLIAGGLLTELTWRLVFLINVPAGIVVVIGAVVGLHESRGPRMRLDVPGALLGSLGCTAVVFGITNAEHGLDRPLPWLAIGIGFAALAAFVFVERTAEHPLLPLRLFADRSRTAALTATLLAGAVIMVLASMPRSIYRTC